MADQDLRYNILVDVNGEKQVKSVTSSAAKMDKTLNKTSKSTKKLARNSRSTNAAVISLGRGIADAAFTPIGALNNIEQFTESMGRAKEDAGGLRGAMKQLGRSMIGPAGISLAIGIASFALTKFFQNAQRTGGGVSDLTKKLNKMSESLTEVAKRRIDSIFKNADDSPVEERINRINEALEKIGPLIQKFRLDTDAFEKSFDNAAVSTRNTGANADQLAAAVDRINTAQRGVNQKMNELEISELEIFQAVRDRLQEKRKELLIQQKINEFLRDRNVIEDEGVSQQNFEVQVDVDSVDNVARAAAASGDTSEAAAAQRATQARIENEKRAARILGTTRENLLEDFRNSKAREVQITKDAERVKTQATLAQQAIRNQAILSSTQLILNAAQQAFGQNKALAFATGTANAILAGINTTKTMSNVAPFPIPQIMGGITAALMTAQAAKIKQIEFGGGGQGSGSGGSGGSRAFNFGGVGLDQQEFGFGQPAERATTQGRAQDDNTGRSDRREIRITDGFGNLVARGSEEIEAAGGRDNLGVPI